MKTLSTVLAAITLFALQFGLVRASETIDSYASEEGKLNMEMKRVGDFDLFDKKGKLFEIGHILLDFGSVFTVLAGNQEARGECEFMHADVIDVKHGKPAIHKLRYFIRFENSVIYLNSDLPTEEIKLTFDFDPSLEIIQGSIVNNQSANEEEIGKFRMRIKDMKSPSDKK